MPIILNTPLEVSIKISVDFPFVGNKNTRAITMEIKRIAKIIRTRELIIGMQAIDTVDPINQFVWRIVRINPITMLTPQIASNTIDNMPDELLINCLLAILISEIIIKIMAGDPNKIILRTPNMP